MRIIIGADHAGFALKGPIVEARCVRGATRSRMWAPTAASLSISRTWREMSAIRSGLARPIVGSWSAGPASARAWPRTSYRASGPRSATMSTPAHQCVEHDDANVLCLGAQIVGDQLAFDLLRTYLDARFSSEEHFARRVQKLAQIERDAADELKAGQQTSSK